MEPLIFEEEAFKPIEELWKLKTYELLLLLKECRKRRSEQYELLSDMQRINNKTGNTISKDDMRLFQKDYLQLTEVQKNIERLIKKRLDYVPRRLDDRYLSQYLYQMTHNAKKG
uniref:hypothetical protein n=1 Tax=Heyndrickxia coagulans TaxID=1398 RepID=UPI00159EF4F4|nr:hypothetical protein [Heyndrickxia coagulans]